MKYNYIFVYKLVSFKNLKITWSFGFYHKNKEFCQLHILVDWFHLIYDCFADLNYITKVKKTILHYKWYIIWIRYSYPVLSNVIVLWAYVAWEKHMYKINIKENRSVNQEWTMQKQNKNAQHKTKNMQFQYESIKCLKHDKFNY